MQISASIFTDPAMRSQLQAYYENKKTELIEAVNSRPPVPDEIKIKGADGQTRVGKIIQMTGEQMANAMVPFDKWLEFQIDSFNDSGFGPQGMEMAQEQIDHLKENNPDSSSNVQTTFSSKGALLAYINDDGSLVTHSGADFLQSIARDADEQGFSGKSKIDYLNREIESRLSQKYSDLNIAHYNETTTPTKREFAQMWYPNHDVDQSYNDAMIAAKASYDEAKAWHDQWQKNMNEIRDFLLSFQEVA